jgi:hypothetical protein
MILRKPKSAVRLIEPRGRPHMECPKCRGCVVWPATLTDSEAAAFAEVARRSAMDGARYAYSSDREHGFHTMVNSVWCGQLDIDLVR